MTTVNRLMRSGRGETRPAPKVLIDGKVKYYDPVERNDFWWNDKHKLQQHRRDRDAKKD